MRMTYSDQLQKYLERTLGELRKEQDVLKNQTQQIQELEQTLRAAQIDLAQAEQRKQDLVSRRESYEKSIAEAVRQLTEQKPPKISS